MSHVGVGTVIDTLLTNENLRTRFALDPIETIAELCLRGAELTGDEIDLLYRTDAGLWFLGAGWKTDGAPGTPFAAQGRPV